MKLVGEREESGHGPETAETPWDEAAASVPKWLWCWLKHGDKLLFTLLICATLTMMFSALKENKLLAYLMLVAIAVIILELVLLYLKAGTDRLRRIAIGVTYYMLFVMVGSACLPQPGKNDYDMRLGACRDNLRTLDGALMQYEADHGVGTYPTTIEELVGAYIKAVPECPYGGCYYLDNTITPPRTTCSNGHTY